MAADEALLESALTGVASFRLYSWSEPTVSLGYFQPWRIWHEDPTLRTLPMVRRPSGGETLVHHHELTYALALPAGLPWQQRAGSWVARLHRVITAALAQCNIVLQAAAEECSGTAKLCFQHPTPGDGLIGSMKVLGSAQRKRRGSLLQHGAILLATSPFAPELPGVRELTGCALEVAGLVSAIETAFAVDTGWQIHRAGWTADESRRITELKEIRYMRSAWNCKR